MNSHLNLPDGFITILEAQARRGRALYGERWSEIEKASDAQVALGEDLIKFATDIDVDGETIRSLGEDVVEAARKSWKYRTRIVTDLLDEFRSGALKGYRFRPGQIPEVQPSGLWQDPKIVHGLLAGYVYEGPPNQRRKVYIIVREDELAGALKAHQPSTLTEKAETTDEAAAPETYEPKPPDGKPPSVPKKTKTLQRNEQIHDLEKEILRSYPRKNKAAIYAAMRKEEPELFVSRRGGIYGDEISDERIDRIIREQRRR